MKLNLSIGQPKNLRNGYTNIDPFASQEDDSYQFDLHQLDCVDDSEAEEIIALNCITAYPYQEIDALFNHWFKKLKNGGTLTIDFFEIRKLAKDLVAYRISLEEFNKVVHHCVVSMEEIKEKLVKSGFKINTAKFIEHKGIIICQK